MQNTDWHLMEAEDVVRAFSSDMYTGLPEKKRRGRGKNRVWYVQKTSAGEYALACFSDLATVLLVVTALFAAIFEGGVSAILLCGLLLLGAVLRVATYVKARRILEACAEATSPTASVLRDGRLVLLRAEDVVPGDIVFLEGGDTVVADGRMIAGDALALSERGITANRDTVHKTPATIRILHRDGADAAEGGEIPAEYRANMLYAGATVLFGSGRMIVTATGKNTLICHKQGGIPLSSGEKLPFMDALSRFCRTSSLCMLALVLVFTLLALFCGTGFSRVFLVTMAMAVASMSEFLPALAYSMIAISVRDCGESIGDGKKSAAKAEQRGAVITNIAAIEDLSRVKRLVFSDMDLFRSGNESLHAFWTGGALHTYHAASAEGATALLQLLLATVGAESLHTSLSGSTTTALSKKYRTLSHAADFHAKITGKPLSRDYVVLDRADGRRAGGLDTVLLSAHDTVWAVVSGGIREVMQCAVTYFDGENAVPMTEEMRRSIFTEAARLTVMGGYVVACARRTSPYTTLNRLPLLQSNLCFMGFAAMVTPPEEGTRELLAELRRSGFSVAVLSEDTELDLYYGREIGLFTKHSPVYPLEQAAPSLPLVVQNGTDRAENCLIAVPEVMTASLDRNVNRSSIRLERLRALFAATKKREEAVTARLTAEKERYLAAEAAWKAKNRRFFRELASIDAADAGAADGAEQTTETIAAEAEDAENTARTEAAAAQTGRAAQSGSAERPKKPSGKTPIYGESAVICKNVLDARLLSAGDIGIAVGTTLQRPIPQPLKAKADAVAYPPSGHGGIAEVVELLCAARRAMVRIHAAAVYLMTSQAARFVFAAVCAAFGGHFQASLPTPAVILTWGLLLDFLAALTMAFRKPESVGEMLSCTASELGLPGKRDVLLCAPIVGLVWGGTCAALYPLLSLVTAADPVGIVTAAMYLCQCAAAGEMAVKKGIFARFHVASGLFALCSLALFWYALAAFTGEAWCMAFAVVPAVLVWGVLRLIKRLS